MSVTKVVDDAFKNEIGHYISLCNRGDELRDSALDHREMAAGVLANIREFGEFLRDYPEVWSALDDKVILSYHQIVNAALSTPATGSLAIELRDAMISQQRRRIETLEAEAEERKEHIAEVLRTIGAGPKYEVVGFVSKLPPSRIRRTSSIRLFHLGHRDQWIENAIDGDDEEEFAPSTRQEAEEKFDSRYTTLYRRIP